MERKCYMCSPGTCDLFEKCEDKVKEVESLIFSHHPDFFKRKPKP